jgi:hypothetical protein
MNRCLLLFLYFNVCTSFILKPFSLRSIVINRAVYTSFMEKMSVEIVDDSLFSQMTHIGYTNYAHYVNIFISTFILLCLINKPIDNKMENIEQYILSKNITKNLLVIVFIIFIKNIETAS